MNQSGIVSSKCLNNKATDLPVIVNKQKPNQQESVLNKSMQGSNGGGQPTIMMGATTTQGFQKSKTGYTGLEGKYQIKAGSTTQNFFSGFS